MCSVRSTAWPHLFTAAAAATTRELGRRRAPPPSRQTSAHSMAEPAGCICRRLDENLYELVVCLHCSSSKVSSFSENPPCVLLSCCSKGAARVFKTAADKEKTAGQMLCTKTQRKLARRASPGKTSNDNIINHHKGARHPPKAPSAKQALSLSLIPRAHNLVECAASATAFGALMTHAPPPRETGLLVGKKGECAKSVP